jgi:hypothetical protein
MVSARPRFLLAVCKSMRWCDGGIFASERAAAIRAAQEETSASQIIPLRAGDDPQAVVGRLKRSLVIAFGEGSDQRMLLVGFYFAPPHPTNPLLNLHRRPTFSRTTDVGMVVKFASVPEARACLMDVKPFASSARISVMDWQEPQQ